MRAFIVLGLVFAYQAKRLAWGTSPKYLLCVDWDVKPQLNQSVAYKKPPPLIAKSSVPQPSHHNRFMALFPGSPG